MTLSYWLLHLAPLTVIQPIFMVSEIIFPCLIGMLLFKEIKGLNTFEIFAVLIGLAGCITIAFSF